MPEETRRPRVITEVYGKTRVKQSFSDEVDINKIMAKYTRTGQQPQVNLRKPLYGDFSNVDDYLTATMAVKEAEANFAKLPAAVRARVDNDPTLFLRFVTDKENKDEIIKLGLASQEAADIIWPPDPEPEPAPPPDPEPEGG